MQRQSKSNAQVERGKLRRINRTKWTTKAQYNIVLRRCHQEQNQTIDQKPASNKVYDQLIDEKTHI